MSHVFICHRCNFDSDRYSNMVRHINKIKNCSKKLANYKYSDDQILILTILPRINNKSIVEDIEIEKYNKSNKLYKNKDKIFNVFAEINKNRDRICTVCNAEFTNSELLKKHFIIDCFIKQLESEELNTSITNINSNNTTNNTINNNTNITNNINVKFEMKNTPIPFGESWDMSLIPKENKFHYIFHKSMYTTLLDKIMENKNNLNVIIDDINKENGIVYKNDVDQYEELRIDQIIRKTMDKLKDELLGICSHCDDECYNDFVKSSIEQSANIIRKKYTDYRLNNHNIQDYVKSSISQIYKKNSDDAIGKYHELSTRDPSFGY